MIRWLIGEEGVKVVLVWHSSVLGAKEIFLKMDIRAVVGLGNSLDFVRRQII